MGEVQKKSPDFPLIVVLLEGQTAPGLQFLRRMHWIITPDPASEKDVARMFDAAAGGGCSPGELWRYTSPYRGLEAMEEKDSDYFFGRTRETVEVLDALAAPDRLPVLIGNSGVGKSSLAQAGVLAALKRQAWPEEAGAPNAWPAVFQDSRQWCFLSLKPGTDPLKALVESFLDTWQFEATDPERVKQQHGWIELLRGKATLSDLIDATERRRKELDQPKPPAFLLYVDQGEELYVRAEEHQRRRFSELLAQALPDPRLRTMMSMRSDFLGSLQNDEPLFKARQQIDVPPLREAELREVVSRPAQLLAARFESEGLIDIITPPHRRGFGQGRGRFAAPVLHARRHVDANGASGRRDAAPSGAILRTWRRARRPCQHVSGDASGRRSCPAARSHFAVCDCARGRRADPAPRCPRGVLRRGVAARRRAGRLSQSAPRHRDHRDGRDLRRGGARGDFPALGQAARMGASRARVPGLAQRPRGRAPRLAGDGGRLEA